MIILYPHIVVDACVQDEAFHCDGYRCIPNRLRCDKYTDCKDGTDEMNCLQTDFESCDKVWEAGYRTSGRYTVGQMIISSLIFQKDASLLSLKPIFCVTLYERQI
jgi:hypothetical protein